MLAKLSSHFGIEVSVERLRRICKQAKLSWKRVRGSLISKRDPELFLASQKQLSDLIEQEARREIDLVYFDQSGFTLEPYISSAWSPIGETIEIPCSKSKRLNVLGFMTRDCRFESFVFEGSVNTSVVVACIDEFAKKLAMKPTVLVLDNASIHTSYEFEENIEKWEKLGLHIVYLSPYSPELNAIEILWRKIKYEWMPFSAYDSFASLRENLFEILANIGTKYVINFAK